IRWASPFSPFYFSMDSAFTRKPAGFWPALVMSNSLAWACLALAGWQLGRHWQDRPAQEGGKGFRVLRDPRTVSSNRVERARLLTINPIYWLLTRDLWLRRLVWFIVLMWG